MKAVLSKWILGLFGWSVEGLYYDKMKSCVIVVAPHTSNWDFVWGMLARNVYRLNAKYLIKDSFFKPGMAWFFRMTGGIPVDRNKKSDLTERLKTMLTKEDRLQIVFTPEGTRKRVEKWRTGFYWVAVETNLPIVMHSIDFKEKLFDTREPFYPTGDWEKDKKEFETYYANKVGCNQEEFNPRF
ncbi:MAG: 1-acyl-sn-glycerol-3-phosphate acyltransferase [Salibacteraceae bacterium]